MKALKAHYDGNGIHLDEPCSIQPDTPLVVIVLEQEDREEEQWYRLAMHGLSMAYDSDEPDYSDVPMKETNPGYKP